MNSPQPPNTRTFSVTGLTCEHCVRAVNEEVGALDGVTTVEVELVAGGTSRVTVAGAVTDSQIAAALDEAGDYRLI